MDKLKNVVPIVLFLTLIMTSFQNCGEVKVNFSSLASTSQDAIICDPLGDSQASNSELGLWGRLYALAPDQAPFGSVFDYITYGIPVDAGIFLSQLYVPTRSFDEGFQLQSGERIKNANGMDLFEYFAVDFQSQLQLAAGDSVGAYQLALLSDDGAVLSVEEQGQEVFLINNDGEHATRMACSMIPLNMSADVRVPVRIRYFQGPRYHISLVLLWREWPVGSDGMDPLCGSSGNGIFFDEQGQPAMAYMQLLARGWKVVRPENFRLPTSNPVNPCASSSP